ncbi:MAG: hypothetical protein ACRDK4_11800 [Solirubrobacteraceae bacterium]
MTARDRLVLIGVLMGAILVGGYLLVVSPERQKASKAAAEVLSARSKLQTLEGQAAEATAARNRYTTAYASVVRLGPAVPASGETPSLVYALASLTNASHVELSSLTDGGGSSSSKAGSAPAAGSAGATTPGAASAAFSQEPFTFAFTGTYSALYKLLAQLENFTKQTTSGAVQVNGRLLTIDGVTLSASAGGSAGGAAGSKAASENLTATVSATAYVLPPGQTPLGGATPGAPVGATPASASATGSSPTSPAVVQGATP